MVQSLSVETQCTLSLSRTGNQYYLHIYIKLGDTIKATRQNIAEDAAQEIAEEQNLVIVENLF